MTYLSSFLGRWNRDSPWNALWAMMIGFFMIMVDATIVAVANPTIMTDLGIGYDAVIWVTSSYLLGYAVVLLVAGRLGDRFGTKNLYLIGLVTFTLASLWCGLSGSAAMLIAARVVQGVGAGMLTPQTLSTITRIFPPERRGAAMSVWGATAGVASLVGPLAGGVLVDSLGWEWIFFVNLPIGVVGVALAVWLVPVAAHPGAPVRPTRRRVVRGRRVRHRVRAAAGPVRGVGAVDLGRHRGRHRADSDIRVLAIGQPRRAADPAGHLRRPQLQPVQRRRRGHRVRHDGDGAADDVLRAGGVRAVADPLGAC